VDVLLKSDNATSSLLGVRSDHCVMLMNPVADVADMPSSFQHSLLQLALPVSHRDAVNQQLSDDPSALHLVAS